jgi:hypothetical protein
MFDASIFLADLCKGASGWQGKVLLPCSENKFLISGLACQFILQCFRKQKYFLGMQWTRTPKNKHSTTRKQTQTTFDSTLFSQSSEAVGFPLSESEKGVVPDGIIGWPWTFRE